jgi:hypothetical protein
LTVHAVTIQLLPWIAVSAVLLLTAIAALVWGLRPRKPAPAAPLPDEWALTARPVFSTEERRIYRLLREALPHHIILSKLPLVRFCQPTDPNHVRYWYDLLGAHHVALAVCSANGRVLAAIDLDNAVPGKPLAKKLVIDLLAIGNARGLAENLPAGAPFRFPYHTPESIQVLDRKHVVIVNDNNYPDTGGRGPTVVDATEWIWLELANPL